MIMILSTRPTVWSQWGTNFWYSFACSYCFNCSDQIWHDNPLWEGFGE